MTEEGPMSAEEQAKLKAMQERLREKTEERAKREPTAGIPEVEGRLKEMLMKVRETEQELQSLYQQQQAEWERQENAQLTEEESARLTKMRQKLRAKAAEKRMEHGPPQIFQYPHPRWAMEARKRYPYLTIGFSEVETMKEWAAANCTGPYVHIGDRGINWNEGGGEI